MPVRKTIPEKDGVYFITFTCAGWLPLFSITDGYKFVYKWFDVLKAAKHYVIGYVIMPDHLHGIIAFTNTGKTINSIIGNGKRFLAYDLIKALEENQKIVLLHELTNRVNDSDKNRNKLHEVFEPSFDWKECRTQQFIIQKLDYIHWNPCKSLPKLAASPELYKHSSARFYLMGDHAAYPVMSYMELSDIDLTKPR
jgi:REP element-mobilizing transposase RayT